MTPFAVCLPGDCPCRVNVERQHTVLSNGFWWTAWCHDRRAVTPDGEVLITETKSTSVTVGGEVSVSITAVANAISAKIGFSVTHTKGIGHAEGCHGLPSWREPHGVWWQEKMGWAYIQVDEITSLEGGPGWQVTPEVIHKRVQGC